MGRSLVLVFALSGCSSTMTRVPHDPRPGEWIVCTDSSQKPTIDAAVSGVGIFGGIGAWVVVDDRRNNDGVNVTENGFDATEVLVKTAAVLAVITGIAYGFSAIYGYSSASSCRKLKEKYPRGYGASLSRTQPESARL